MPNRDWSVVTAFGVIVVVCVGFAVGLWAGANNQHQRGDDNQGQPKPYSGTLDAETFWQVHAGTAESYQAICDSPIDSSQADLCQQWRSAKSAEEISGYTFISLWIGLAGLLGLGLTVVFARGAVLETRRIGEAQVRAYLTCSRAEFGMSETGLWITVHIKNFGQSPAVRASIRGTWVNVRMGTPNVTYHPMGQNGTGPIVSGTEETALLSLWPVDKLIDEYEFRTSFYSRLPVICDCRLEWETVFGSTEVLHFSLIEDLETSGGIKAGDNGKPIRRGSMKPGTQDDRWIRRHQQQANG